MKKQDFLFDVRLVQRHINAGLIDQADYEKHLASLEDVADKSEPLSLSDKSESKTPE